MYSMLENKVIDTDFGNWYIFTKTSTYLIYLFCSNYRIIIQKGSFVIRSGRSCPCRRFSAVYHDLQRILQRGLNIADRNQSNHMYVHVYACIGLQFICQWG